MKVDLRKWVNVKVITLFFIIILGVILIYLGVFCINYTKDTITSYSSEDTGEVEY